MNRDSRPSFSFGFSQLETIKEYENIVNFVPDSFDYESVGFGENRSKHKNDSHTMKKLRQKHAKKDKKEEIHGSKKRGSGSSASKAPAKRRRFVEVISRDELPKLYMPIAEYLSEELDIPSSSIDAQYHRLRYASLLCKYGSKKAENGYFSENDDPPKPKSRFSTKEKDRVLHIQ
ncbi:hypothetical protein BC332_15712 [Capsicum chinense]|nr:hypothetical protein BC332_15712 [Capsicum chinense]